MILLEEFRRRWVVAIFGILLYLSGIILLFWNEARAITVILSLEEASKDTISINIKENPERIFDGRSVHLSGPIVMGEPLTEPDYNIQVLAVKLKRRVQMYQWVEEAIENNFAYNDNMMDYDDKTFYYTKEWRDKLIDSRQFHSPISHRNPEKFPIESQTQISDIVTIGDYKLGMDAKNKFNEFVEITSDTRPDDQSIKMHLGLYYHCNDLFDPQVGEVRILFSYAGLEGDEYTIIGKLQKGMIVPYESSRKTKILLIYRGKLSLNEMFKISYSAERFTTWTYRLVAWFFIFCGTTCTSFLLQIICKKFNFTHLYYSIHILMKIFCIVILVTQISLLRQLAPTQLNRFSANLKFSISISLLITAMAWAFYRSIFIGAGLVFAAVSPFLYCARSFVQYQRIN